MSTVSHFRLGRSRTCAYWRQCHRGCTLVKGDPAILSKLSAIGRAAACCNFTILPDKGNLMD